MSLSAADLANQRMVDRLIAEGALWSRELISAFRQTPRHRFLQRVFVQQPRQDGCALDTRQPSDQEIDLLYADRALITRLAPEGEPGASAIGSIPISSSSQPSLMAEMLEDLRPQPGQRVLEIGTGTGYNAALLAHVVGPSLVHSVDVDRAVLAEAEEHLATFPDRGVQLHHGDGREGWPEQAPFDRLIVTAATPDLEPAWLSQVKDRGAVVAPVVLAPGMSFIVRGAVRQGVFKGGLTRGAYFMPLRAEEDAPQESMETPTSRGPLKSRPAPWEGWFDRHRPRLAWSSFVQALVFYGWLRGLDVLHSGSLAGYSSFGVSRGDGDATCWFNSEDWQITSDAGLELGDSLWQAWLAAGGPWPTEWSVRASAEADFQPTGEHDCVRQGPRCRQIWELNANRDRPGWR